MINFPKIENVSFASSFGVVGINQKDIQKYKHDKNPFAFANKKELKASLLENNSLTKIKTAPLPSQNENLFAPKTRPINQRRGRDLPILPLIKKKNPTRSKSRSKSRGSKDQPINLVFNENIVKVPKNPRKDPNYTFRFYVNRTYRKQIPLYMQHRVNWEFTTEKSNFNFRWKYYAKKIKYKEYKYSPDTPMEKLKIINIFEKYSLLGNKEKLFINLYAYASKNNINLFEEIIPFTVILSKNNFFKANSEKLGEIMKGEHIGEDYSENFHVGADIPSKVKISFPSTYTSNQNYFIIKPINLYQGIGMKITNKISEIVSYAKQVFRFGIEKVSAEYEEYCRKKGIEMKPKKYKSSNVIIQKYLDNPLLYYNRKFDIRCYVLVDMWFNVYICREGHLKACSVNYDINCTDVFSHLTNYSLQKKNENFAKFEEGNEISYLSLINSLGTNGNAIFGKIYYQMKRLIKISMNSVGKRLMPNKNTLSFQIFGYDFIVDKKYNPYILEVNDNPGLEISSTLISKLIPRMVDDAFRLTIDNVFETRYNDDVVEKDESGFRYKSKYKLDGYSDYENVFEFLCNINQ